MFGKLLLVLLSKNLHPRTKVSVVTTTHVKGRVNSFKVDNFTS